MIDIDTHASRIDGLQRLRVIGTGILTPAENSEMSTAISVSVSITCDWSIASNEKMPSTTGPRMTPAMR